MAKRKPAEQNPALKIEYWPIDRLLPYERNPRRNDKAIPQMVASIKEYGFTIPVLAKSDGLVIDGHLRLKAALQMKLAEVPVIPCDTWTEAQIKAFRLMVNRSVAWADWDMDALALEFGDLKALDFDLTMTGFNSREIDALTLEANAAEDDAPPLPADPVTKQGDLYLLGPHRLLCGDSTSATDVARLMGDRKAGLMNTDPPYGVDYSALANSKSANGAKKHKDIANDNLKEGAFQEFLEKAIKAALPHFTKNPAIYLWHPMLTQGAFAAAAAAAAAVLIHRQIVWVKPSLIMGRGDYHWRHELCFYGWIQGSRPDWLQGRDQDTVWNLGRENDGIHPTQKPVELFRRPILNHLTGGAVCYEPFGGSGSQFIAAEATGRVCYGLELDPGYCDVIVSRWEKLTGKKATLEPGFSRT